MTYTPLYIKTEYSYLKSLIKIDDLVIFAKKNNLKSLGIADENMCGAIEFYQTCIKNNIKPLIGLNIKIDQSDIILYAKNYEGYQNLLKIDSINSNNEITIDYLNKYQDNLLCIVPFKDKKVIEKIQIKDKYIGFKNKEEERQLKDNKIYFNEVLYLDKKDKEYLKYLTAIKDGKLYDDIALNEDDNSLVLNIDYDLTNNYKVNSLCDVKIETSKICIPKYTCPKGYNSYSYLKALCKEGLKKHFGEKVKMKYIERLKYELSIIDEMHFCDYFLIVWDYVKYAKENNIMVGPGRGSAASSLVSYCLDIIEIDPLKYDLLFERFLNKERLTLPDIDIDFDGDKVEEVIEYCKEKYGDKNVASIITFSSLTTKQVLKDVGKVLNIDGEMVDYFTRMFVSKNSLKENYEKSDRIRNHIIKNPELKKIYDISLKLENLKKHFSVHASGVVISDKPLDEMVPLIKYRNNYLIGYQANYLEKLGLIKMDFLALKTLTTINSIVSDIKSLDYKNIPFNDRLTIQIFQEAKTLGVFQFESFGMMSFLKRLKPVNFEEIYHAMALYRPGPMDNINLFIKRRNNEAKVNYYSEDLKKVLKPTYGIIIYQEQIMQIAHIMADYTLAEADILRRATAKKDGKLLKGEENKFISRAIDKGYSNDVAKEVYNLIYKFAEYGFNKAHAVAYSVISYKMAYLKAHYPLYFMKDMFNRVMGSIDNIKECVVDCKENNVLIMHPDINNSMDEFIIKDEKIVFPFSIIHDVNINMINNILNARRKGLFKDIFDFIKRIDLSLFSIDSLKKMILIGTFDSLGLNRQTLIQNLDIIINYADLTKDLADDDIEIPNIVLYDEYNSKELMNLEYQTLGFYLNSHPVNEYRKKLNKNISINNLSNYIKTTIDIIVRVEHVKKVMTKKQDRICFIEVSDEYSNINMTVFSNYLDKMPEISYGDIIMVNGRFNRRNGEKQIIVNKIRIIDKM